MTKGKATAQKARGAKRSIVPAEDQAKRPAARLQNVEVVDGVLMLTGSHDEYALVNEAFGTESTDFHGYCLNQLINILPEGENYTVILNAALATLKAINPKDELEAMLAVQMVASNHLSLMSMRRTQHAQTVDNRQMEGNLATKFSRTFVAQLEALGKHRRGGKQIVEHVHVNAGGQAVIAGTVNTGGGKS